MSIERYGFVQTFRSRLIKFINRFVEFEICVACMNSGKPYDFMVSDAIPVESITAAEDFHHRLHPSLSGADYQWAFNRGDQCVANIVDNQIVGYGFSSSLPTRVVPGVEFFFPQWCSYGYASMTAAEYRGKRLAKDRWPAARKLKREQLGYDPRDVYYMSLANSATLKGDLADGVASLRLGYCLWLKIGKVWCWNSRAARRNNIGFRRAQE